ncbi:hypothetical protein QFZ60_000481 [Arthrobacter sp. B2I5]|uniref:hypothetical protein n=1 Tax=Arthrobacter sp. B2I5 TaxID=3042266 RepID=UPI00278B2171|nr:hypothetical protein [Arthrobacter sp. B2I5]MDQ0824308.1 hypothetical protein [Arthrobacter sp. B2I5]
MIQGQGPRPKVYTRLWAWKDADRNETPGVGLFRGQDLQAHLTPGEARTLADKLHDLADRAEANHQKETC